MKKTLVLIGILSILATNAQAGYNFNDTYYVIKPYSNKATDY